MPRDNRAILITLLLLVGVSVGAQTPQPTLRLPSGGAPKPAWLSPARPAEWFDWSADFWRIPNLDANPLLLGVARFRATQAEVLPRLERTFGPKGGNVPNNPIFVFERDKARFLARVVPVVDVYTGREQTDLVIVAYPATPKDCRIAAPPGSRALDDRWLSFDEGEFSRPSTVAAFAGGGDDRRLRAHFQRTLGTSRLVEHGSRQWVAGRVCDTWVLATFQDKTPWDEKAWVTRVIPAPAWIVVKLEQGRE